MTDPDVLRPFVPVGGAARVLITSTRPSAPDLGTAVPVDVFTADEAQAFLAGRTGRVDAEGPRRWPPNSGTCRWRWHRLRR